MEKDVLAAADHLRNQLGLFYWTIQRDGDLDIAVQQLRTAVCVTERDISPWCRRTPPTMFTRWCHRQTTALLGEAKQVLTRLGQCPSVSATSDSAQGEEAGPGSKSPEAFRYGPLT